MPINIQTGNTLPSNPQNILGNVNIFASNGDAINLGQATMAASLPVAFASDQSPLPVSVTFPPSLAVTQSTTPWVISGSVSVSNFPATQAINLTQLSGATPSATNFLPSRISNGTVYVDPTQIRLLTAIDQVTIANASIAVTGTLTVNQGTSPWVISGAVTGPLTDAELRASAVPVSLASLPLPTGAATSALQLLGNASLVSIDSKLTSPLAVTQSGAWSVTATQGTTPWVTSLTAGGNAATIKAASSAALAADTSLVVALSPNSPLPTGSNTIGALTANQSVNLNQYGGVATTLGQKVMASSIPVTFASNQSALPVTGTFFQATQPVSIAGTVAVSGPLTDAQLRATPVPVSGTVTANLGTIAGVATETTLSAINTKTPALGQALAAASVPVVLTAAQLSTLTPLSTVAVTGPLTDAQLRATPVPVSGTVSLGGSLPAGTNILGAVQNSTVSSAIVLSAPGDFFLQLNALRYSGIVFEVTGTWVGIIRASASADGGSSYNQVPVTPVNLLLGTSQTDITTNGLYYLPVSADTMKISLASYTSGTVTVRTSISTGSQNPSQNVLLAQIAQSVGAQSTDTIQTGTIAALNGTVAINAQGAYTVSALITGTWVGTLVAEGLMANGTTWVQVPMYIVSNTLPYAQSLSTTVNGSYLITGGGYTSIRIRTSAYTSGTVNVALNASLAQQTVFSAQLGTWVAQSQGTFNTTLPTLTNGSNSNIQLDSRGRPLWPVKNGMASFSTISGINGFTAPASANKDVFRLSGSATKTVYIKKIRISATATATQANNVLVLKRSTANTGGTTVAATLVPLDSTFPAATASAVHYTATSTTDGTNVGGIRSTKLVIPAAASLINSEAIFEFSENGSNPLVLRGTAEGVSIAFNVAPGAGNNILIDVNWDEE